MASAPWEMYEHRLVYFKYSASRQIKWDSFEIFNFFRSGFFNTDLLELNIYCILIKVIVKNSSILNKIRFILERFGSGLFYQQKFSAILFSIYFFSLKFLCNKLSSKSNMIHFFYFDNRDFTYIPARSLAPLL